MAFILPRDFLDTVPKSLDESAILDGATKFQVFTKIVLPLSKPNDYVYCADFLYGSVGGLHLCQCHYG